jgi:hypothetical protein
MKRKPHTPLDLVIDDLEKADRAEILIEYWGGHLGTSEQSFSVNEGPWLALPQPEGMPGRPECYNRTLLGNPAVELPLQFLKEGRNSFRFHAGPQICHDFGWGFYWIYAFTVRIYYAADKTNALRCRLEIGDTKSAPADGSSLEVIDENPTFSLSYENEDEAEEIERTDLVGLYYDYDWEGNGLYRDRHYQYRNGQLRMHIGSSDGSNGLEHRIQWNTEWLPDQLLPVHILPFCRRTDGFVHVGRELKCLFKRSRGSVVMHTADRVPEAFCVRVGQGKTCFFRDVGELSRIEAAAIALSTWSADHADEIGINGTKLVDRIGLVHDYSYDLIQTPVSAVQEGANIFYIFSRTEHHAAEINWPGPALLLRYR